MPRQELDDFEEIVKVLCQHKTVKALYCFKQHGDVDRLTHSLNVAKLSFLIGKKLGLDCKALAKAGLLHDFHHSERFSIKNKKTKVFSHALTATQNAQKIFGLTKKEENIIRSHMFPLSLVPPKSKEAVLVNCVDKYCTIIELFEFWFRPRQQRERVLKVGHKYKVSNKAC